MTIINPIWFYLSYVSNNLSIFIDLLPTILMIILALWFIGQYIEDKNPIVKADSYIKKSLF